MQTINYLLSFVFFCLLAAGICTFIYFIYNEVKELRQRQVDQEKFYNMKYQWLSALIDSYPVDKPNYDYLFNQLLKLGQMKHKDRERTQVLTVTFFRKFLAFTEPEEEVFSEFN